MSVVHYKFKNNLEYETVSFDGLSISLGDLKRAIMAQNKTKSGEFDLEIKNAQTKEVYKDDSTQIQKNASVVIRRIPLGPKGKALTAAERPESPGSLATKPSEGQAENEAPVIPLSKLNKVADLATANASEDDKIAAMMNQAGEDWDPALYARAKGRYSNVAPRVPPPAHYLCFRCRKPGHWIQSCPTNGDPNYDMKVRRTTGIPKSFLRLADKPTQKGALLIAETGQYAVPIVDHHAYEQAATKKRSKDVSGGGMEVERAIPKEYLCPICKKVMTNAVVVPCCGESFCDQCIVSYLLEKEHVCPSCGKDNVSPDSIIINKLLRQAIIKFRSSNQEGSFSATSSPSALRDEDGTARQERTTPVPVSLPVSTSAVTTAHVAVTEKVASPDPVVTTSVEPSQAKSDESNPSIARQVTTSPTHTPSTQSAPNSSQAQDPNSVAGAPHDPVSDARFQRAPPNDQQVSESYAQPLRMSAHGLGSLGPIHHPSYVVASSALAHHHHAMVHATIPSLGIPAYGHLPHPALIPGPPALPFADLDPDLGLMMNEEEFYRAKMKLAERGRKKRRGEDDTKRKRKKDRSRSRRRERLVSPSSRRTPPNDDFAFELANYQAVQRDRLRRRSRSRSWTPSGSSSLSNSSWSHSWSRSKSPSRSYSRSKSRTPVNWDRSRSPTPSVEKSTKPVRPEVEDKKRKKPGKDLVRKRSKIDPKDAVGNAPEKLEASSDNVKSQELSKKGKDAKTSTMKKESRKKDSDRRDATAKKQSTKASERLVGKTATGQSKTKQVIRKDSRNSRDSSPVVKTRADVKMKASSRGGSPVERKTTKTQEKKKKVSTSKDSSVATAVKKTTKNIKKKKETASCSNAIPDRTATADSKRKQKDTRESELVVSKDTIPRGKKRTSSKRETVRREGSSEIKQTSVREKSSVRRDSNSEKQIKKKSRLEVNALHSEKRDKVIERKKSGEKQKKGSVSGRTDKQASLEEDVSKEAKVKKREGKKKKQRKSVCEDIESSENREERRMSRKRPKEIKEDVDEDVEKSPKKRKKKRTSVDEEPAKDTKHKKRKHKKKHRKRKHKKKTKHKEKKKKTTAEEEEKNDSEAASSLDFENELGDGIDEGDKGVVVDNEEHSGESSKSEPGLSESEDSGGKDGESGSEYENDVEEVKNEDNESEDEGSLDGGKGMCSEGEGEHDDVDVENEAEKMEEEQEEDDEEVEEEEVEDEESGEEEEIEQPSEEENESDIDVDEEDDELEAEAQNSEVAEGSEVDEMEEEEEEEKEEELEEEEGMEEIEYNEDEEVMEELDENEENEEEEGKDNVDESGDEQDLLHGDDRGEYTGDTAGDEALLGSDADGGECSENEEDIEDLLGEDEAVDGESETGNENPEQDLSVSDVPEDNLNESVDSCKEIQDLSEADLPNDDSQNVNETELFSPTADDNLQMVSENSKQNEVKDENQIVCQSVASEDVPEDKVNPLSEPSQTKPFSDASHEPLETVKRSPQLEFQRRNGIGDTPIDTRPKSIQFENFRRFDSGLGTLSSLDSTPELDDPNYTDFDAPPMFIDDRRTSNDILQALINDETEDDF